MNISKLTISKILMVTSVLLLVSCSSNEEIANKNTPVVENSASSSSKPGPSTMPIPTFPATIFTDPLAVALITDKDLPDYKVFNQSNYDRTEEEANNDATYNNCIGPTAPFVAQVVPEKQLNGDTYAKLFPKLSKLFISSTVIPSSTGKKDVDYFAKNKNFVDCYISYLKESTRISYGQASNNYSYKVISYKDNVLVTIITADAPISAKPTPSTHAVTISTFTDKYVIQYYVGVVGSVKSEMDKIHASMVDQLTSLIKVKSKALN